MRYCCREDTAVEKGGEMRIMRGGARNTRRLSAHPNPANVKMFHKQYGMYRIVKVSTTPTKPTKECPPSALDVVDVVDLAITQFMHLCVVCSTQTFHALATTYFGSGLRLYPFSPRPIARHNFIESTLSREHEHGAAA